MKKQKLAVFSHLAIRGPDGHICECDSLRRQYSDGSPEMTLMHLLFYFHVVYSKPKAGLRGHPLGYVKYFFATFDIPSFQSAAQIGEAKANGLIIV